MSIANAAHCSMMGGSVKPKPPWDYRVAYLQISSGIPRFKIPTGNHWNSALPTTWDKSIGRAITDSANASCIISAPAGANTGDRKLFGSAGRFGLARLGGKWRPAGIMSWPTQPTASQIPFIADVPVKAFWRGPNVYGMGGPNGESFNRTYSPGGYAYNESLEFGSWEQGSQAYIGTRQYEASLEVSDPTYGFKWRFVPCMKDGVVYICDVYSGLLVGNTGTGTVSVGPQVPDDYCGYPY